MLTEARQQVPGSVVPEKLLDFTGTLVPLKALLFFGLTPLVLFAVRSSGSGGTSHLASLQDGRRLPS